jgi:hypothetical protein
MVESRLHRALEARCPGLWQQGSGGAAPSGYPAVLSGGVAVVSVIRSEKVSRSQPPVSKELRNSRLALQNLQTPVLMGPPGLSMTQWWAHPLASP